MGDLVTYFKTASNQCIMNEVTDSAMFSLDRNWVIQHGTKVTYLSTFEHYYTVCFKETISTKRDIVSGLACALSGNPTISDNFDPNSKCLAKNKPIKDVYETCPIYLVSKSYKQRVNDLVTVFVERISKEIRYEPCPTIREHVRETEMSIIVPVVETPIAHIMPGQVCYVDLIVALDLGCMNRAEYASGQPQQLVKALTRQIISLNLIQEWAE